MRGSAQGSDFTPVLILYNKARAWGSGSRQEIWRQRKESRQKQTQGQRNTVRDTHIRTDTRTKKDTKTEKQRGPIRGKIEIQKYTTAYVSLYSFLKEKQRFDHRNTRKVRENEKAEMKSQGKGRLRHSPLSQDQGCPHPPHF